MDSAQLFDEVSRPQDKEGRDQHRVLRETRAEGALRAARSINLGAGTSIPQEAEHPFRHTLWEAPEKFGVNHLLVDSIVCLTEVKGEKDELVGVLSVLRLALRLRAIPAILHRLDEPGQTFVRHSSSSLAHPFLRDQLITVRNVGQPRRDQLLRQLRQVTGQGDRAAVFH